MTELLAPTDLFVPRHLGPRPGDAVDMLRTLGVDSLDALVAQAIPDSIRLQKDLQLRGLDDERPLGEEAAVGWLRSMIGKNKLHRSLLGMGYHDCVVPPVIARNILENPGWYTQYTPYQAEISQGRLEALINFQTAISDLTGLELSNASLLDEGTAAAEAMAMAHAVARGKRSRFLVSKQCHPQTLTVMQTRADAVGIVLEQFDDSAPLEFGDVSGVLVQYPTTDGVIEDYGVLAERVHAAGGLLVVAADLLSLTLLRPPGEFGADVAVGSAQRFGVPMGFGGPHAAFFATAERYKRQIPGRIIGVSRDVKGRPAFRMAMQTREQHIRRERATSNICTAQVLLAIMAGAYAVYHGPEGLTAIAQRVRHLAEVLRHVLKANGHDVGAHEIFDTVTVHPASLSAAEVCAVADGRGYNLREFADGRVGISMDERTTVCDLLEVLTCFGVRTEALDLESIAREHVRSLSELHGRTSDFLSHEVFHRYRSEHEMLRYLHRLQGRDLSLTKSMIALGSCTMKLNATSEMLPVSWPEFGSVHPFVPKEQSAGYREMFDLLEDWLSEITGFTAVSLQPNAGSQGEFTGLMVIRAYHLDRGEERRDVCLIPVSAHGTNPASAVMAGMKVVAVKCDERGNIDVADLTAKAIQYADRLAALMVTYPSTHGVFEREIQTICDVVHDHGGLVYLDGANMNAQVGLCRPGDYGADVCHLNLHKTFCIPHGGGGPGMGPIGVNDKLAPYLPGHPLTEVGGSKGIGAVAAAPWGSASILPISFMYIAMMGAGGLKQATQYAILNANYMARRLEDHYPILFRGEEGRVAHEFIIDLRPFKQSAGIEAEDVAKRLMDFGFHAPTMSFPVAGTLMIEPTESESKEELDRFCDAMVAIREEIKAVELGKLPREDNPLSNAPHTAREVTAMEWAHAYSREQGAYPLPWVRADKFWPSVARIDNAWGDRNLICTCPPMSDFVEDPA